MLLSTSVVLAPLNASVLSTVSLKTTSGVFAQMNASVISSVYLKKKCFNDFDLDNS